MAPSMIDKMNGMLHWSSIVTSYMVSFCFIQSAHAQFAFVEPKEVVDSSYYHSPLNADDMFLSFVFYNGEAIDSIGFKAEDEYWKYEIEEYRDRSSDQMDCFIKLHLFFNGGCCANTTSYYYAVQSNNIYLLQALTNVHCDGPEPYFDLILPIDSISRFNHMVKAKIHRDAHYQTDSIEVISTLYIENGKIIETIAKY